MAVPTVPVVARGTVPPPTGSDLRVLVSSAAGVDSPAVDALASFLAARPGVDVVVVATAAANDTVGPTGTRSALIDTETAGGLPAQAVNASVADAVATGLDQHADVDLVVVGIDGAPAVGDDVERSPAVVAARLAAGREVPAIAMTASDEDGLDLSAAVLALGQVLDLHLDGLLDGGGAGVLTVPSCRAGTVRPLVVVEIGRGPAPAADCTSPLADADDDVEAHAAGHATLTRLPR